MSTKSNLKKSISEERKGRRSPEKMKNGTLDINNEFKALPEAV